MSTDNSEKFLAVPTKMTETQNSLENRINSLSEKISQPQQSTLSQNKSQNISNQQKWRGYSRGRFNQNRGNREDYKNPGSNTYQNQNQNQGRYGNNFRGNYKYSGNNYRGENRGQFSKNDNGNNIFQQYDNQNAETTLNT